MQARFEKRTKNAGQKIGGFAEGKAIFVCVLSYCIFTKLLKITVNQIT